MLTEQKTLTCDRCGKNWIDATPECASAKNQRHRFIELMDYLSQSLRDALVCRRCGEESGQGVRCNVAENSQHEFVQVQVEY